jgi:hypothetical protein
VESIQQSPFSRVAAEVDPPAFLSIKLHPLLYAISMLLIKGAAPLGLDLYVMLTHPSRLTA